MKNVTDETIKILKNVLNAGTWFNSALEIDVYEQPYSGEQLEEMLSNLLSKFESREYLTVKSDINKWMPAIARFITEYCPIEWDKKVNDIALTCDSCPLSECGICDVDADLDLLDYLLEEE